MRRARFIRTLTTLSLVACGLAMFLVTTGATKPSDVAGPMPVIASGTLEAPDGSPLANASVVLYLTPPPSASTGAFPIVATTTSGADGSYVLTAANDQVIQASDDWNSGFASFQLMAMTDTATFTTTFSRIFKGGQWFDDQGTPMSRAVAPQAAVRFPKVARSNAVTPIARLATVRMPLGVQPHVGAIANGCMIVSRQDIGHQRQPDDVGEMHNPHDMTSNTYFKYGNTADSSISVGFTESDSGFGGWGVNGTAELSVGHGSSAGDLRPYPEGRWSHRIDIDMDVHEYRYHRQCYARGYLTRDDYYHEFRTVDWFAGQTVGEDMSKLDGRCGPGEALYGYKMVLAPGEQVTRDANDYVRFSVGMTINVPTGLGSTAKLGLSSQSGMSKYVVQHWQAGYNAPQHYLCGDTGGMKVSSRIFEGT